MAETCECGMPHLNGTEHADKCPVATERYLSSLGLGVYPLPEVETGLVPVEPASPLLPRAADRLYAQVERLIRAGRVDARSELGDAALDYREMRYGG